MRCAAWLLALAASPGAACAHDTWFALREGGSSGAPLLALGTGERYPAMQTSVGGAPPALAACRAGAAVQALAVRDDTEQALLLQPASALSGPASCWAQLPQLSLVLRPALIPVYLDEIRAPARVRATAAAWSAQGRAWHETYTKHARIELADGGSAHAPGSSPLALDIVPEAMPLRAGSELRVQVLRDGAPLPGLALELVSGSVAAGFWLRTDDAGRARVRVPLPGPWLLRGTDLRPDAHRPGHWDSRFVTLAFEALAP
jgi:hypothetical protein